MKYRRCKMEEKYNRSKIVKELISQGISKEEIFAKCIELGEKNEKNLKGFINRTIKATQIVKIQ